ncbi:MAG: permease [Deltaproteobacteria bacterium]|nr:permease [Deltaproteobacteria bacterium]
MKKQPEKPFAFRGKPFFAAVLIGYVILAFLNFSGAIAALQKSGMTLLKILPILAVVILMTATINFFLQPKQIVKHLGKESGAKGWLAMLFAGVISHGPMYAWYPLIDDLRRHGMRDGLIVVFFYARAIKIPLLPLMIDYFGLLFTLILSLYILLGAIIQGLILETIPEKRRT